MHLLISFKIFLNYNDAIKYIMNTGVFINFKLNKNPWAYIHNNDIINLYWVPTHYTYIFYNFRKFNRYLRRVKPRIFKMMRHKIDINKQATKRFPKWTLKFISFKDVRLANIEVDYTTWTFIILSSIKNNSFLFSSWNIKHSWYLYKLYNWKYIV